MCADLHDAISGARGIDHRTAFASHDEKIRKRSGADLQNGWMGRHGTLYLTDERIVFVEERGQIRPASTQERTPAPRPTLTLRRVA